MEIKRNSSGFVYLTVLFVNIILFALKLYIGLSSNSISIYSDGINNLFDSFTCLAALLCVCLAAKTDKLFAKALSERTEQLVSFGISCTVFAVGLLFFYNSLERLMYPAPLWFSVKYFGVISATAVVKLLMFLLLKRQAERQKSEIIKMLSKDSLADFLVTSVSVLTLFLSQRGGFSVDAFGGIAISIFIIISAFSGLRSGLSAILAYPQRKVRLQLKQLVEQEISTESAELEFSLTGEKRVYLKTDRKFTQEGLKALKKKAYNETGIKLYIIK